MYEPECTQEHSHKRTHAQTRASTQERAHRHGPTHSRTHILLHSRAQVLLRAVNTMQVMARMRAHRNHYALLSTTSHASTKHLLERPAFNPGRREHEMHNSLSHAVWFQTSWVTKRMGNEKNGSRAIFQLGFIGCECVLKHNWFRPHVSKLVLHLLS